MISALMAFGTLFQWFAGTKVGRIVGLVGAVVMLLTFAFFKVKAMGRAEERERSKEETDKLINTKEKIDADIANDSDSDLDKRVRPWTRG